MKGSKPALITKDGKIIVLKLNSGRISEIRSAIDHP